MQAINGTDSDVRLLATTLNADVNEVRSAISTLQNGITMLSGQTGLGFQQVVNALQSGDASLSRQLCECCCENRLLTTQQGYESQLRTLELSAQAEKNTGSIIDAINSQTIAMNDQFCALKERELQNKIDTLTAANTSLKNQIDNANQTAAVATMLAPIQKEVSEIKAAQPNTVAVEWPQLSVVNTTPYVNGGFYGSGFYGNNWFGNGWNSGYPFYGNGSIWS